MVPIIFLGEEMVMDEPSPLWGEGWVRGSTENDVTLYKNPPAPFEKGIRFKYQSIPQRQR